MKKLVNLIAASLFSLVLLCPMAYADKWKGEIRKGTDQPKPAFCVPASGSSELDINNARVRINTGGNMWTDGEVAKYEIPKGSRKTSMFDAALWIGGLDVNGQLKLAALRYRQIGNDYWTGPLTIDGTASIDQATCKMYDKQWKISRAEVEQFIAFSAGLPVPDGYKVPRVINEWPAHPIDGNPNQSYYLAPFCDVNHNYLYEPAQGDYPYYDFSNSLCPTNPANIHAAPRPTMDSDTSDTNPHPGIVKGGILVDQVLKGDQTIWWVFNDKGAAHTESGGEPIGLEIRAQAFAFATNDEINNMTFYSYEIINRSTYTLTETYFSQWVDTDLGFSNDDFVGCDVRRGLGYCYNGLDVDGSGKYNEYGKQPPAIGVDFFQGPYIDPDGYDSPNLSQLPANFDIVNKDGQLDTLLNFVTSTGAVIDTMPVKYLATAINGVNFGDGIVDNERFGMRRFVFHNNSGGIAAMNDPSIAIEYYNMLKGIWKDNTSMTFGGDGYGAGTACAFMFPGDTDPWNWGTFGAPAPSQDWTEKGEGNAPDDRRFMQSAGPFTLYPGAVNYITVGIPWARAASGGAYASVELLRKVDDKCQILFDNCFKVLDGPDAPDLLAQELDKSVILYINNSFSSNNYNEKYTEFNPAIPLKGDDGVLYDQYYHFEGYQIFQLSDASVSVSDIYDADKARLVFQCDLKNFDANKNPVGQLVNYTYNDEIGGNIPQIMVQGGNEGILHSIKITEDQFATGDKRLVNHKKYYYIAVSYAYNNYLPYSQDPNVTDGLFGQKTTYLAGRKAAGGAAITAITVIPHIPSPEANGTQMQASYGDQPQITRIEGQGNGGIVLDLTTASIDKIMSGSPWRSDDLVYLPNKGPLNIKVVDPLRVQPGEFLVKFTNPNNLTEVNATFNWEISGGSLIAPITSNQSIALGDEQLIPDLGISVQIKQFALDYLYPDYITSSGGPTTVVQTKVLESSISFGDPNAAWLTGVPDVDGDTPLNWIRSGTLAYGDTPSSDEAKKVDYYLKYTDPSNHEYKCWFDAEEQFEKVVDRTWAPFQLTGRWDNNPGIPDEIGLKRNLGNLYSVDVVLTSDKSKWTRCPVIETCDDSIRAENYIDGTLNKRARKLEPRRAHSVDINGNQEAGYGMGWFPGYAINIETGERLNIMFGEDSWLVPYNGKDMKFNPTSNVFSSTDGVIFGGKHFIYIMAHQNNKSTPNPLFDCPAYDEGAWLMNQFEEIRKESNAAYRKVKKSDLYVNAMWTSIPILVPSQQLLSSDVKIRIRVARPYKRYLSTNGVAPATVTNDNFPLFKFNTTMFATETNVNDVAKTALDLINVVPNPYYGFSTYETSQLDNRIKIVNLPDKCTISIYTVSGSMVRQFKKDDNTITSVDWDLKNHAGIPISGGVYIIHVKADGIGEKVIKWFGALRPTDLNSF